MRIVHVSDFYLPRLGGIELHVSDLARHQLAAGHDVTVVTSTPSGGAAAALPAAKPVEGMAQGPVDVPVMRLNDESWPAHALNPAGAVRVGREIERLKPDVVHVHAGGVSPLAFAATRAAPALGVPTVFTLHSMLGPLTPVLGFLDALGGWSQLPVAWTAVSDAAAAPLGRLVGARGVTVLPNGIDAEQWQLAASMHDPTEVVVLAVMRLASRKRPLALLRMLEDARSRLPRDIQLRAVIIGDGPLLPAMRRHVVRRGLTWVDLPGRQTRAQILEAMRAADVFVAPARKESFGIAALEARCAAIPVVADRRGGVTTFVTDGQEGILTASDAGMAEAISWLAAHPAARTAMSNRSRATPITVTWPAVLARAEEVYEQAAGLAQPWDARSMSGSELVGAHPF